MRIDCERVANQMLEEAKQGIAFLKEHDYPIALGIIRVGNDPASEVYVRNKVKTCLNLGIECAVHHLPASITQEDLEDEIDWLQAEYIANGFILQLPLPDHLDAGRAIARINNWQDVDGLREDAEVEPCTPVGIMQILEQEFEDGLAGKHAVVIGRSKLVGKPLAKMLLDKDCTVTVCHSKTEDLASITRHADIVISAAGKPNLVTFGMLYDGAIAIDVGINRVDGKLVGDVEPWLVDSQYVRCTPVPGGVGKTTVAALVCNLVHLAMNRYKRQNGGI